MYTKNETIMVGAVNVTSHQSTNCSVLARKAGKLAKILSAEETLTRKHTHHQLVGIIGARPFYSMIVGTYI